MTANLVQHERNFMNIISQIDKFVTNFLKNRYSALLVFLFTSLLALAPLLFRSTFIHGPDIAMHTFNVQQYAKEFQAGVIYPRWLGDWYSGYGAPLGVVYSPLTYFFAGFLTLLGLSIPLALKTTILLSTFFSGYFLFRFASITYRPSGALAAGIIYQFAPYPIFDLYGRVAIPEYITFMWMPLLLYLGYWYMNSRRVSTLVFMALSLAGLIFTHLQIAVLFVPSFMLVLFFFWLQTEGTSIREVIGTLLGFLLALLLTAVYWLPASLESKFLNTAWLKELTDGQLPLGQEWGNYMNNFLFSAQVYRGPNEQIYRDNIEIGIGTILSLLIVLGAILAILNDFKQRKTNPYLSLVIALCGLVGIFMSFRISLPVWAMLDGIQVIQFPWRWQTVTTLMAALLAGRLVDWIAIEAGKKNGEKGWATSKLMIPLFLLAVYGIFSGYEVWSHRGSLSDAQIRQFSGLEELREENYQLVFDVFYLPEQVVGFDYTKKPKQGDVIDYGIQDIEVETVKESSIDKEFEVVSSAATIINIRSFWFPGWKVYLNDNEVPVETNPDDGTMLVEIPAGKSNVRITFTDTPIRKVAAQISILGFVVVGLALLASIIKAQRKNETQLATHV
jgi:hypothetical protein